ncbi:two-partner secretion domain-containing protein [Pseudomonas indica]|uniref:two-partner secretion domain-containing protein n=1 Tax=Pseudomonas indica TaxID=137658 RepID=UPI003FD06EBA
MDVRSPFFQTIALILSGVLFLNPLVVTAADLAVAAGSGATLTQAGNGVPVVNIAKPNGNGLSHNKFSELNVGQQGLILNNATSATQSTQLGGIILGNANLQGQAAGLILNEVTGGNPSQLKGYTEVAGKSAHVIVANPHGIRCDGCGFLNTPRVTFSTGKPIVENGRLDRFSVDGGEIAIEGAGLNASNIDQFDLITRSARLNAELHAQQLNVITGRNEVKASDLSVTAKADDGSDKPALAIDSSALGGMYAGAIRLVGTEAGVGVKLAGDMAASGGDIHIDLTSGQLTLARAAASRDLRLEAEKIELTDTAYAGRTASVEAEGEVVNRQSLAAGETVSLDGAQVTNQGVIEAGVNPDNTRNVKGDVSLTGQNVRNRGTVIASRQLTVTGTQTLDNQGGTLSGQGGATLNGGALDNRQGQVFSGGALNVDAGSLDNRNGKVAAQAVDFTLANALSNDAGLIESDTTLAVRAGRLTNAQGTLRALGERGTSVFVTDQGFDNADGTLETGAAVDFRIGTELANRGVISVAGALQAQAPTVHNENGLLVSGGDMHLLTDRFTNLNADVYSLGSLSIARDAAGSFASLIENRSGSIESVGDMRLRATSLINRKEQFETKKTQTAGHISVVCHDCSGDHHNVDYVATEAFDIVVDPDQDSAAARLHSGGNLAIQAGEVVNRYSSLSASGDIAITASTLENTGAATGSSQRIRRFNTGRVTDGTDERFREGVIDPYNALPLPKAVPTALDRWDLVSDLETQTATGNAAPAIIQAGGDVGIQASQSISNASVLSQQAPSANPDAPMLAVLNAQLPPDTRQQAVEADLGLPQGPNGLFRVNRTPGHPYLIETHPALTRLRAFVNSDYLLDRLGYDSDAAWKRLGDGLYEQRLIQQAVVARTGKRFLDGLTSDEAMFRYLMDNAIASKEALNLSVGITLTAEQVAALTHDIVWLEEREVLGQKVLVPVLYLAQAKGRLAPTGALIQGRDVALISGSELQNSGTLRARRNLDITGQNLGNSGLMQADERLQLLATDSIRNAQGGIIAGRDVSAIALTGDIVNERTIAREQRSGKHFSQTTSVVDSAARIEADNGLHLSAGRDLLNLGGALSAGDNAGLSAGRDLVIAAAQAEDGLMRKDKRHYWNRSTVTQYGSDMQVGGDLAVEAGRDLAVIASKVKAGGDVQLEAGGDMAIAAAANESSREYRYKGNGKKINKENVTVRQQAAAIEAGGDLLLSAEGDMTLAASKLKAGGEAYLYVGHDLGLLAAENLDHRLDEKKKKGAWGSKASRKDQITRTTQVGSEIVTGGDLTLASEGDQRYQAAHLQSGADLTLDSGSAIVFEGVKDSEQQVHEKSKSSWAWNATKGKGNTDETLRQSELIAQGALIVKAAEGIRIDIKQVNQQTVSQTIDAMVKADPQLAWLKQAEARGDVDWRRVKEIHESFKYSHSGLGAGAQLIIAIVMAAIIGPMAAGLGAVGQAVTVSVATQATVSTINNRGNLGAVAKDVTSSNAMKGYVVSAATAGLVQYNPAELGMNWSSVGQVATKTVVDAGIKTAVYGGSFKDNLGDAAVGNAVAIAGAIGADAIGDYVPKGSPQKLILHAALGGLLAEASGGDFRTGALAAGANEALVDYLGEKLLPQGKDPNSAEYRQGVANLMASSQLIGVLAAVLTGGDAESAAAVTANATQYNYLRHQDVDGLVKDLEGCDQRGDCQQIRDRYLAISDANRQRLAQCEQNGNCAQIEQEILAGQRAIDQVNGYAGAVLQQDFSIRQWQDGNAVRVTLGEQGQRSAQAASDRSQRQYHEEMARLGQNPQEQAYITEQMAKAGYQAALEEELLNKTELARLAELSDAELDRLAPGWREYRQQAIDTTGQIKSGLSAVGDVLEPGILDALGPAAKAAKLAGIFAAMRKAGAAIPTELTKVADKLDGLLAGKAPSAEELAPFKLNAQAKLTEQIRLANQTLVSKPGVVGAKEFTGGFGPMYRPADSPQLEKILTSYFGKDKTGARVGNGGVADALRYEKQTGNLLSEATHEQKVKEMQARLNNFVRKADNQPPGSYPHSKRDVDYARELLKDLNDALKR